jgi:hypothetical protein
MTLCGLVRRYQRSSGTYFLHLQGIYPGSSKMSVRVCVQTTDHEMIPAGGMRVWATGNGEHFTWLVVERANFANVFRTVVIWNIPVGVTFVRCTYVANYTHRTFCDMATKRLRPSAIECTFTHCVYIYMYFWCKKVISHFAVLSFRLHSCSCTTDLIMTCTRWRNQKPDNNRSQRVRCVWLETSTSIFKIGYSNSFFNKKYCACASIAYLTGIIPGYVDSTYNGKPENMVPYFVATK